MTSVAECATVVVMGTPRTTASRLQIIADTIEHEPGRWNQMDFCTLEDVSTPRDLLTNRKKINCGTTMCVAGFGVSLLPLREIEDLSNDWDQAGAYALGLTYDAASSLFYWLTSDAKKFPDFLRKLAEYPEPRTTDNLIEAAEAAELLVPSHWY